MAERTPARPGGYRAKKLGLVAGILSVALVACGHEDSPTSTGAGGPSAWAGQCHIICSEYSTNQYVAIAVSPSRLLCGSAANLRTLSEAKTRAVATCGQADCVPVIWGQSGVAAVAVNRVVYGWGWAPAASSTADSRAIASCESRTP
jgi:hypothetical protein